MRLYCPCRRGNCAGFWSGAIKEPLALSQALSEGY
jgi:hypothetical protein